MLLIYQGVTSVSEAVTTMYRLLEKLLDLHTGRPCFKMEFGKRAQLGSSQDRWKLIGSIHLLKWSMTFATTQSFLFSLHPLIQP